MKPTLILLASICFVWWALQVDAKYRPYKSAALLLPIIWLAFISSRPPSYWFDVLFGIKLGGSDVEGSPVNSVVLFGLILSAINTLTRRRISWSKFFQKNWLLLLIYLYLLVSATWSPTPLASSKRLIKDFGCVVMALVILTETNPSEAIRLVFARVAYILVPLSLVLAKYFPAIGRGVSSSGESNYGGVCFHKNSLGLLLIVSVIILAWEWMELRLEKPSLGKNLRFRALGSVFVIIGILLVMANCATAYLCLTVAWVVALTINQLLQKRNGKTILVSGLVGLGLLLAANSSLGISDAVAQTLGRNPNFTGRTVIWQGVLAEQTNPLIGMGFYSFWDSPLADNFFNGVNTGVTFIHIKTCHNGYMEAYVDGGLIAVGLLLAWLLLVGKRSIDRLFTGNHFGRVSFVFWFIALLYNLSESDFFRLEPLWFCLLLVGIDYSTLSLHTSSAFHSEPKSLLENSVNPRN